MNLGLEDEAFGVHQNVALTSLDLLASVITSIFSTYSGSFNRLGIDYASAGLRIPLQAHPQAFSYGPIDPLPGTVDAPLSEVVVINGGPCLGKS
jgi:hypothetical protein